MRPDLFPRGEIAFDPGVLFDFAFQNFFRRFYAVARQIFSFRHDAHAHHVIVLRDVPEPAFLRHEGNGGRAFIDAGIALGTFVISPHRDFVQERIFDSPLVAHGGESFLAGAIERHGRAKLPRRAIFVADPHTNDSFAFAQQ